MNRIPTLIEQGFSRKEFIIEGIVVKNMNGYFYVQVASGDVKECKVRGRLKKDRYSLLVGDKVTISEDGFIESIIPRHNTLKRPAVANIDQVMLVVAAKEPNINELLLNRLLLMIEHADIPLIMVINKWDLHDAEGETIKSIYERIGYQVLTTSTLTGDGIDELKSALHGKVTAFAGPSGVGKSSLLNAVDPNFSFATGEVSQKIKRGRHTTRHASLFSLDKDSFIMDTPGFSSLEHSDISLQRLPSLYPEFLEHEHSCKFSPCFHEHEPVCGVKDALEEGKIHTGRYDSYLTIRHEIQDNKH